MSAPPPSNGTAAAIPPSTQFASPPPPNSTTEAGTPTESSPPPPVTGNTTVTAPPPANTTSSSGQGGLSNEAMAGLIVGIVIGALIVLVGVGIFVFFYKRKKRKQGGGFGGLPRPQGPKDGPSSGPPQSWKQDAPPPPDYKVTIPPKPTLSPGISSNPNQPPPYDPNFSELPSTSDSLGPGKQPHQSPSPEMALGFSQSTFTYEVLATATDGFSDANLVGQGGFGYVHKGVLPNGKVVAVKQLKVGSGQGEREFRAEVEIISRVHHRHLVSLVGYCISGTQRMLVYEFVPNNTLELHLHGKGRPVLSWPVRMKIALGSAKGLAYLHEDCQPKIIHRDIKAANILLEHSFEPKVADFGLAKYALDTDTHVSTRVMGTFGYLAPEYAASGKLTEKSDVFSFGVVLLELITGRRPVDRTQSYIDDSIVDWAKPLLTQALEDGNFDSLVDPRLQKEYDPNEMTRVVACAAACVRHSARRRPRMSQIVRALEGNMALDDLNEGVRPGHSTVYSSAESSEYNSSQYKEDLEKFRKMALETQEHGSSECSGPTSESGVNLNSSSTEGPQTTQEMELQKMETDTKKTV